MTPTAIATVVKMIESLPENVQEQVIGHLRVYLQEMRDEAMWNRAFGKTQPRLIAAARRAKKEIADGHAKPFKHSDL